MVSNLRNQKRSRAEEFIRFQVTLIKPGESLPPLRMLSENSEFGLPILMNAIKLLVNEGVLEARERSGYFRIGVSSQCAKGANSSVVDIIACSVIHYLDNPISFNQDLIESLVSCATAKGYSARIHRVNLSDPLSTYADLIKAQNMDKVLLIAPHTIEIPRIFIEAAIRNVSIFPKFPSIYGVQILDNPADMQLAMEYLYKNGQRRIAYLDDMDDALPSWTNMSRTASYYRFAAENGLKVEHSWLIPISTDREALFNSLDAAFVNAKKCPDAIVAHEQVFFFLKEYFAERKLVPGKDIALLLLESSLFSSKYANHRVLLPPLAYLERNLKGTAELALTNLEKNVPGSKENIRLYAQSKLTLNNIKPTKNKENEK